MSQRTGPWNIAWGRWAVLLALLGWSQYECVPDAWKGGYSSSVYPSIAMQVRDTTYAVTLTVAQRGSPTTYWKSAEFVLRDPTAAGYQPPVQLGTIESFASEGRIRIRWADESLSEALDCQWGGYTSNGGDVPSPDVRWTPAQDAFEMLPPWNYGPVTPGDSSSAANLCFNILANIALGFFWPLLLAPVILFARIGRRAVPPGICPECGYNMSQGDRPGCPECGWGRDNE